MKTSSQSVDFSAFQKKIGVDFKNLSLLKNAFVHRSYLNEKRDFEGPSNERLEFLGDSVLSIVVSKFLFEMLPGDSEGGLTKLRASLVRTETLAKIAKDLALGDYLLLSKGEEETGGRKNTSILANTFEALIGAIYQDKGLETAQLFLKKTILKNWQDLAKSAVGDYKSKLQETTQRKFRLSPNYKLLDSWGPDHARQFRIGVYIGDDLLGTGLGKNKQEAAQKAAQFALGRLKQKILG